MNPISSSPAPVAPMPAKAPSTGSVDPAPKPKLEGVEQVASQAAQKAAPKVKANAAGEAARAVASTNTMSGQKVQEVAQQTRDAMQAAVQQIQGYLQDSNRNMNVALDETTGYYVARVTNSQTGEVVRSIPSDETLRIAHNIEMMRGMLVNQRA
jgi:flagellar protein FlaG